MKIGLDLDCTLTAMPEFFSVVSRGLLSAGHEVHVITYRTTLEEVEHVLQTHGIARTAIHVPNAKTRGEAIWRWKAAVAAHIGLDVMIDDSPENLWAMPVGVKRLWLVDPEAFDLGVCIDALKGARNERDRLRDVMRSGAEPAGHMRLPLHLGKSAAGRVLVRDLQKMPNLLLAGTAGSGKSDCLSAIILSLCMQRTPDELKMILIDPDSGDLSMFRNLPHLLAPVVTEMKTAPVVLKWVVRTMEKRYDLFRRVGVTKIESFNQLGERRIRERLGEDGGQPTEVPGMLPCIVVIIDELASLMMVAARETECAIARIAQKSRSVGIHLVLATQRPSVGVITGLIKSNISARISFKVASKADSRTILDRNGAERLLGQGDMLMLLPGNMNLARGQCTLVTEMEIKDVVDRLRGIDEPSFDQELDRINETRAVLDGDELSDELFDQAVRIVIKSQRGSASLLQRKLKISYNRAARLLDMMAKLGYVGEYQGSKAREVLMSIEQYEGLRASEDGEQADR